jgi:hypothetical protein
MVIKQTPHPRVARHIDIKNHPVGAYMVAPAAVCALHGDLCPMCPVVYPAGPDMFFARVGKDAVLKTALLPAVSVGVKRSISEVPGLEGMKVGGTAQHSTAQHASCQVV